MKMEQDVDMDYRTVCTTCLSSDRDLFDLAEMPQVNEIFRLLMYDFAGNSLDIPEVKHVECPATICWECLAMLRRVHKFKWQVHKAQEHLRALANTHTTKTSDHTYLSQSLSTLATTTKVNFDKVLFDYSLKSEDTQFMPISSVEHIKKEPIDDPVSNNTNMDFVDLKLEVPDVVLENAETGALSHIVVDTTPLNWGWRGDEKMPHLTIHTAKPPKTKAEYQKEYRERQKAKKKMNNQESTAKPPKTKAEYQKEYRERQKAKKKMNKQESTAKRPKTNAEHQKAFRERQKINKRESTAKPPKTNAEHQKAFRERQKINKRVSPLNISWKSEPVMTKIKEEEEEPMPEYITEHMAEADMLAARKRKKLDSNEDQENVVQCKASQNLENVQLEQNELLIQQLRIYEESHECITPKFILHRNTDIPGDVNCLFHSLIRVLQLQISTCDLRRQLRDSPYLNSCHNPQEAYNILSSNNEYGDLDCLYLFAKIYNQNICVHDHYFNVISKNEDTRFCHFKRNDTHNWIHLDLRELHFTPYFSDDDKRKEDERKQKQKNKEYSKRYRDKKRKSNLQTEPSARDVLDVQPVIHTTQIAGPSIGTDATSLIKNETVEE